MRFHHTLSFKIITPLVAALAIVLLASTWYDIRTQSSNLTEAIVKSAEQTSAVTKKALRHSMEQNLQSEIWRTIADIGSEAGVEHVRVYDKFGTIRYSTDAREAGRVVDKSTEACAMCHVSEHGFEKTTSNQYVRIFPGKGGYRVLGFINPIENEPGCWQSACHAHTSAETYLGVLDVQMSLKGIDEHISSNVYQLILSAAVALLAVGLVTGYIIYTGVHKPIRRFIVGTREIASGNLEHRIDIVRDDEIGDLAASFNQMASDLNGAQKELLDWSATLERRVQEKTSELQGVQAQVLQMEKMASLGKLSAMIAHELNNPLSGILTYARLVRKRLGAESDDAQRREAMLRDLDLIADEAKRCGDIVKNLLYFARAHQPGHGSSPLADIIEKTVRLIAHKAQLQQVTISTSLPANDLTVDCDDNQLQQVLLALIINAVEAMPDGGTLTVTARESAGAVSIAITDTGVGIAPDDLGRIFEPFFTTKETGYGAGLGLSIVFGIVKQHGGEIAVDSTPGKGSAFTVTLPLCTTETPPR